MEAAMSDDYSEMSDDELWNRLNESDTFEKGQILFQLHHRKTHEGEYRTALACAEQAVEVFTGTIYSREVAIAKQLIGHSQLALKDYETAIKFYKESADISVSCGADGDTALSENWIGEAYWRQDDFENAALHYKSSAEIFVSIDDNHGAAMSAREEGDSYMQLGKFHDAIHSYLRSIEHAKAAEHPHQIYNGYFNLTYAWIATSSPQEALDSAEKALALAKTCSCPRCEIEADALLGEAQLINGDFAQALVNLEKARKSYYDRSDTKRQASVLTEIGLCHITSNPKKAREHLRQALTLADLFPRRLRTKVRTNVGLGILELFDERCESASEYFAIAYLTSQEIGRLKAERHAMLPYYFDALLGIEEPEQVINILDDVSAENDPWLLLDGLRYAYAAKAHLMMEHSALALEAANAGLLIDDETQTNEECRAVFHHIRAQVLKSSDPHSALMSAHKAMAYYLETDQPEMAKLVGQTAVIEPDRRVTAIAAHDDNRNTYEELFGVVDPIAEQVDGLMAQVDPTQQVEEGGVA